MIQKYWIGIHKKFNDQTYIVCALSQKESSYFKFLLSSISLMIMPHP
jgi:hypothetical protein